MAFAGLERVRISVALGAGKPLRTSRKEQDLIDWCDVSLFHLSGVVGQSSRVVKGYSTGSIRRVCLLDRPGRR